MIPPRLNGLPHLSECWLLNHPDDEDAYCTCDDEYPDADSG